MSTRVDNGRVRGVQSIRRSGRTGRRPGDSGAREAILAAARRQFAAHGYRGATIRGIAAEAGVDPALLRHYFGDKDALFAEALEFPAGVLPTARAALAGPREGMGRRLASAYLGLWEDPATGPVMAATLASVVSSPQANQRLRDLFAGSDLPSLLPDTPPDEAAQRLTLAASHLLGLAIARHVVHAPALTDLPLDTLVDWVAPAIQGYLTGPRPGDT